MCNTEMWVHTYCKWNKSETAKLHQAGHSLQRETNLAELDRPRFSVLYWTLRADFWVQQGVQFSGSRILFLFADDAVLLVSSCSAPVLTGSWNEDQNLQIWVRSPQLTVLLFCLKWRSLGVSEFYSGVREERTIRYWIMTLFLFSVIKDN